ncbi:3-deoxy-D-manno-octulosonic acid transferase [Parasediminibacterium sp. JCM 36343]|uniref:3-deoxy-D-manno-octulosonic acid transferase n=1 Tax=Parasediminibacterium sp. JCM 36343 TaxID=3374279 RepID=UPI00397C3977
MKFFYQIFIYLYPLAARLLGYQNEKARLWVKGRENIFERLRQAFEGNTATVVWVHCSSLGEFEQGKPVIEQLKIKYPASKILVTFFSPSGYEVRKHDSIADWVFYLPMDSAANAKQFFDIVKPKLILFVKYEFWYYYLQQAKNRQIPLLLVSGIFRAGQPFFKWYGSFNRGMLLCFNHFFVQDEASASLLKSIGIEKNVTISGDTRFDRVLAIAQQFQPIPAIEAFIGNSQKVIVAGSTWLEDDKVLHHYIVAHPEIKFIIAPHDIQQSRIDECVALYGSPLNVIGQWSTVNGQPSNVLLINTMGMLSKLYHYATIAFIGGGFGEDGIHNALEAAVYGKPVLFGPEYSKYIEAIGLVDNGAAFSVENALELEKVFDDLFNNPTFYQQAATAAKDFVAQKAGATERIVEFVSGES